MKGFLNTSKLIFPLFLICYHFLFTFINWNYFSEHGGDASFYWFLSDSSNTISFSELVPVGSELILMFNYFFAKTLALDIKFGFFLYSCFGFLGIFQFYRFGKVLLKESTSFTKILFYLVLLLPNLHFWTASVGKESFCFLFLATFFYEASNNRYLSFLSIVSVFLLSLLRPHVSLFLLSAVGAVFVFFGSSNLYKRIVVGLGFVITTSILFFLVLKMSKISYFDWERIQQFNRYSLLSFENSGSYVSMVSYSYPYKLFTFYFRPFLGEMKTFYGFCLELENLFVLLLHIIALYWFLKNYRIISGFTVSRIIILYVLIFGIVVVQRYSGFGIFARTKIMFQPFMNMVLVWVLTFKRDYFVDE